MKINLEWTGSKGWGDVIMFSSICWETSSSILCVPGFHVSSQDRSHSVSSKETSEILSEVVWLCQIYEGVFRQQKCLQLNWWIPTHQKSRAYAYGWGQLTQDYHRSTPHYPCKRVWECRAVEGEMRRKVKIAKRERNWKWTKKKTMCVCVSVF